MKYEKKGNMVGRNEEMQHENKYVTEYMNEI